MAAALELKQLLLIQQPIREAAEVVEVLNLKTLLKLKRKKLI
jgi:hypothetical protein